MNKISRRTLLKGAGLAGVASAVGIFNATYGFNRVLGQDVADDDTQTIINVAATAELFATTHYLAAINAAADLELDEAELAYMKAGFLAEQDHYELLTSLGATPVVTEFYVPETLFSDRATFAATTDVAERTFVAAYLAAVRIWGKSEETNPFAVTAAQIAAVEAQHLALARRLGVGLANNVSYAEYLYNNTSDAVPTLQAFLDGSGEGFIGPVTPPTAEDIEGVRAEIEDLGYNTESQPFAAMEM
ncbi:MAG: ferritin-like domain-containing protein [bacterium]|nr:ferritin-like domain-containing protein [bacterium]